MGLPEFSDFVVYVDESGHASPEPDPNFPCFVLAFCLFRKASYVAQVVPKLQKLKFDFFGHDMVIFHEREIRKAIDDFAFLKDATMREEFHRQLGRLIEFAEFEPISKCIRKDGNHLPENNLYHIALQGCLEELFDKLEALGDTKALTHVVFEKRGKNEDGQLELEFRRICAGENRHQRPYPFIPVLASKQANSTGLQFADLFARPIGLHFLRPEQTNRAYEIIRTKQLGMDTNLTQGELDIP